MLLSYWTNAETVFIMASSNQGGNQHEVLQRTLYRANRLTAVSFPSRTALAYVALFPSRSVSKRVLNTRMWM